MEIVIGIIVFIVLIILIGKAIGTPEPSTMSTEALLARIQSERAWIEKYKRLPYEKQQGDGIKNQYEDKNLYVMLLQLELMKKGVGDEQETVIPVLQRGIELMRGGMNEEEAQKQATEEYVKKRDSEKAGVDL